MTPSQLLKRLQPAAQQPGVVVIPQDYATSSGFTTLECIKTKHCPICGAKGWTEHYYGNHPQNFYFCSASKTHTFEYDEQSADRVET